MPIRDPRTGKSRLRAGTTVNAAIAHDTLTAALGSAAVDRVVLITDRADWLCPELTASPRMHLVRQRASGLPDAISHGLSRAGHGRVAVMLGDLPSLTPSALTSALVSAEQLPLGMVTDHCGTGTTLITARRARDHRPGFGPGSAALHHARGYAELPIPVDSCLRRDVDTPDDLAHALRHGIGQATRLVLEQQRQGAAA